MSTNIAQLRNFSISAALLAISLAGCASPAHVDRASAQATSEAPLAAQVAPPIIINRNPALPTYVVAVEPFAYAAVDIKSGQVPDEHMPRRNFAPWEWWRYRDSMQPVDVQKEPSAVGPGLAAQLMTALSNDANLSLVDSKSIKTTPDGTAVYRVDKGERGLFIIRGTVTEFTETSEKSTKGKGGSLGMAGVATAIVGRITDSAPLAALGIGTAVANPSYNERTSKRTGMVGIDMQIVNASNGRIVGALQSHGSFTTVSAVNGMSVFGIGTTSTDFAASAIGQATRAAMNDAVMKIDELLSSKVR